MESIKTKALRALNPVQKDYLEALNNPDIKVIVALGFGGTGKTMLATATACDRLRLNELSRLLFTRPAISSSKTVGLMPGTATEKLSVWLQPVMSILKDRLGAGALEVALKHEDIHLVPLEVVKGLSLENEWLICDEASDLTKQEVVKLITRVGEGSKIILCGDVNQKELKEESGLSWLASFVERNNMQDFCTVVNFNKPEHIVRSDAVKRIIIALSKEGYYNV